MQQDSFLRSGRPSPLAPLKLAPSAILALVLAPAIGGCSLVPDYNRPDVALAATWNTSPPASRGAGMVQSGWWRRFGSGELNQFLARSLSDALTLQIAVARLRQAEGTAQVVAAPQFPTLDLTATLDRASGVKSSQTQQVLAQASYEIDFWGKNRAAAGSGDALVSASAFDADTVAMTLSASVANTYFTILSLRERIRLAQQIAADARQVLDLVQIRRQAGTATDLQVQQQQSSLATFEAVVPALRQQKDVAIHALAVLTGQAPEGFTVRASTLNGLARPAVLPDLPPALLARRPDIQAAEARLMSANFDVGVARAAFFPSLSLNAALGAGSATLVHFLPPTALTDVGANLLQPLFHAGQLEGQLKFSREKQTELVATYRQTVLTAFQDVEDALSTLSHVSAQEKIEAKAVTAAQGAADLAQLQYRLGSADYLSVLATEQALYQARDALLQLRLLHLQAIVGLCRALGGGFDHADNSATASVADREAADRTDGDAL